MKEIIEDYFMEESIREHKKKYLILIIYDIVENRKRTKLAKYLEQYGFRVQKSAFEARMTQSKYQKLVSEIGKYVGANDSIRIYKLNGYEEVKTWGDFQQIDDEEVIII